MGFVRDPVTHFVFLDFKAGRTFCKGPDRLPNALSTHCAYRVTITQNVQLLHETRNRYAERAIITQDVQLLRILRNSYTKRVFCFSGAVCGVRLFRRFTGFAHLAPYPHLPHPLFLHDAQKMHIVLTVHRQVI